MAWSTITANVSEEALGIREFGSSKRSSVQVPPLTSLPVAGVLPGAGAPQAPSKRISTAAMEKAIIRDRDGGLLSIKSSLIKQQSFEEQGYPPRRNHYRREAQRPYPTLL